MNKGYLKRLTIMLIATVLIISSLTPSAVASSNTIKDTAVVTDLSDIFKLKVSYTAKNDYYEDGNYWYRVKSVDKVIIVPRNSKYSITNFTYSTKIYREGITQFVKVTFSFKMKKGSTTYKASGYVYFLVDDVTGGINESNSNFTYK